jgi:very-short-patch-repair endonuclease
LGITVIHFWNKELCEDVESVLKKIRMHLERRDPAS